MVAHDPHSFLEELVKLFEATRDKGSVVVTFKRVQKKGETVANCLVRAKTTHAKLVTTVTAGDAEGFNATLASVFDRYVTPQPKNSRTLLKSDKAATSKGKGKGDKGRGNKEGATPVKTTSPVKKPQAGKGGAASGGKKKKGKR